MDDLVIKGIVDESLDRKHKKYNKGKVQTLRLKFGRLINYFTNIKQKIEVLLR